jgi:hypothetical protein
MNLTQYPCLGSQGQQREQKGTRDQCQAIFSAKPRNIARFHVDMWTIHIVVLNESVIRVGAEG